MEPHPGTRAGHPARSYIVPHNPGTVQSDRPHHHLKNVRATSYWPVKLGGRRSRKESRASWTSCGARRAHKSPNDSCRSCSSSVASMLCCRVRRAACMAMGGQEAMVWASAMASSSSLSDGTRRSRTQCVCPRRRQTTGVNQSQARLYR